MRQPLSSFRFGLHQAGVALEVLWRIGILCRVGRSFGTGQPLVFMSVVVIEAFVPRLWRYLQMLDRARTALWVRGELPASIFGYRYREMDAGGRAILSSPLLTNAVRYRPGQLTFPQSYRLRDRGGYWVSFGSRSAEYCVSDIHVNARERYCIATSLIAAVSAVFLGGATLFRERGSIAGLLVYALYVAAASHLVQAAVSLLKRHYLLRMPVYYGEPYSYRGEDLAIHMGIGEYGDVLLRPRRRVHRFHELHYIHSLYSQRPPAWADRMALSHAVSDQHPAIRLPNIDMPAGLDDASVPECFKCALMNTVMRNPVIDPRQPNIVYDLSSIMGWLRRKQTNPYTRQALRPAMLKPAHSVRAAMSDYLDSLRQAQVVASRLPGMYEQRRVERLQRQMQQQWLIERRADNRELQHAYDQRYGLTLT